MNKNKERNVLTPLIASDTEEITIMVIVLTKITYILI